MELPNESILLKEDISYMTIFEIYIYVIYNTRVFLPNINNNDKNNNSTLIIILYIHCILINIHFF